MTDADLNALFAVHVAGITQAEYDGLMAQDWQDKRNWLGPGYGYCASMDAVLPYLTQCPYWAVDGGPNKPWMVLAGSAEAEDPSLPRACVLALLRAQGVGV